MLGLLFRAVLARWPLVALCVLATLAGGLGAAMTLPPRYTGEADILMELVRPDPETGEIVPSMMVEDYVGTQMRLAASGQTTRHMIAQFGWLNDPTLQEEYLRTGGDIDGMEGWLANRLASAIGVSVPEETNILRISYVAPDPDNAKLLTDAVRTAFLTEVVDRKRRAANQQLVQLERQARVRLDQYNKALEERNRYAASRGFALGQHVYLERDFAKAMLERNGTIPQPSPVVPAPARSGESTADRPGTTDREEVASSPTAFNQLLKVRTPASLVSSGDPHLATLRSVADKLGAEYMEVIKRRNQVLQDAETGDSNLSAFGDARVSDRPSFPNYPRVIGGALLLGLVLGIEVALLIEMFRSQVRIERDLARVSGAEVMATVRGARRRHRLARKSRSLRLPPLRLPRLPRLRRRSEHMHAAE